MALCMIVGDMQSKSDHLPTTTDKKMMSLFLFPFLFNDGGQKGDDKVRGIIDPERFHRTLQPLHSLSIFTSFHISSYRVQSLN